MDIFVEIYNYSNESIIISVLGFIILVVGLIIHYRAMRPFTFTWDIHFEDIILHLLCSIFWLAGILLMIGTYQTHLETKTEEPIKIENYESI